MNVESQQSPLLSDFTYGELSPRMLGRTETAVYHKGAQQITNFVPMIQGGFRKRTGFIQVGTSYATAGTRLARMVISGTLWYLLEFTNNYLRIWKNGITLVTQANITNYAAVPYLTAELASIQFGWAYPDLFIAQANHPPAMLAYTSLDHFTFVSPIPMIGSAATYLTSITLNASNKYFPITNAQLLNLPTTVMQPFTVTCVGTTVLTVVSPNPLNLYWSLVGKYIFITGDSVARLVDAVTATTITLHTATSVTGTAIAAYGANTGLPITGILAGASMFAGGTYLVDITTSQIDISATPTAGSGVTVAISQDIVTNIGAAGTPNLPFQSAGNYPGAVACANQRVIWMGSTNGPDQLWASVVGIFDTYGNMDMQVFELVAYNSQQISTNSAGQPLDSSGNVITAQAQNTPAYINVPQTQEIVGDADGFTGSIYSDQNDAIQWCVSATDIILGTLSGQIEIDGGATANTYAFRNVSRTGSAPVQGYFMTGGVLFVDRAGKRIMLLNWQGINIETPPPVTLSLFSEHLFEQDPVTQVAYSTSPVMRLWFLRASGTLVCCEFDDQYDVKAWFTVFTGYSGTSDVIQSIAVGPNMGEDDLYIAVARNGYVTIEMLTTPYWAPASYSGAGGVQPPILLDSAVQKYNATPYSTMVAADSSTIGGVAYTCAGLLTLVGRTVACWGDGACLGTAVVSAASGGSLTLPALGAITTYKSVIVGLPYTSTLVTMPFELGNQMDSTQASLLSVPRVGITYLNTLDCGVGTVNSLFGSGGGNIEPATLNGTQATAPTLFTGTERGPVPSGFGFGTALIVQSSKPLPCTITAIVPMVETRERE